MKEYTISGKQANLYGLFFLIPILLVYGIPYILIWRAPDTDIRSSILSVVVANKEIIQHMTIGLVILIFLAGIIIHELIHGACMALFAKNGFKSVSFGFNIKALAPYAHCKEPLDPTSYRICLMMPAALLGELPILAGWISGNILLMAFGILFLWASSGDLIILWISRRIKTGWLQDHPDKVGFILITDNEADHTKNNPYL